MISGGLALPGGNVHISQTAPKTCNFKSIFVIAWIYDLSTANLQSIHSKNRKQAISFRKANEVTFTTKQSLLPLTSCARKESNLFNDQFPNNCESALHRNSATLLETDRVDSQRGLMQFWNVDVNAA